MKKPLIIGTRGSQLALWQAEFVKSEIQRRFPDQIVELNIIKTTGDAITDRPLALVGGKGLFVKEIENALLTHEIDLAVHSMKDMPGDLPEGLIIGAVPPRANPFDVLIATSGRRLSEYESGARIGTSSLRRASQIRHLRPDLRIDSIRGNLDTRIRKLQSGDYDAIVLAAAGLIRLGQDHYITQYLDDHLMIPAVGQGALCIETRDHDSQIERITSALDHYETRICVEGERAFLQTIGGSCHIPVACFGRIMGRQVLLSAMVASEDGRQLIREQQISPMDSVQASGNALALRILEKGGKTILETLDTHDN